MKRLALLLSCLLAACSSGETVLVGGDEETVEVVEDGAGEYPLPWDGSQDGASCDLYGEAHLNGEFALGVPVLCDGHYIEKGRPPEQTEAPTPLDLLTMPEMSSEEQIK